MSTAQQRPWPCPRSMSRAKRHRTMGALLVMLGLVGGLAVVLTGFLGPAGVARADTTPDNNDNPYFTLTMTPSATQNLVDGQAMPFTVTRTALGQSTGLEIAAVGTGWCASDVQLPVSQSPGNQNYDAMDHRVSPGQLRHSRSASPELSRLRQLRFELHNRQRHVVARHCPPAEHHHERRWHGRRLSDGERPGFGRDRPGRTTAAAIQQHFGQLPAQ